MTFSLFSFPPAGARYPGLAPRSIHATAAEEGGCMKMYAQLLTAITSSLNEQGQPVATLSTANAAESRPWGERESPVPANARALETVVVPRAHESGACRDRTV